MTTRGIRLDWKPLFLGSAIVAFLIRQMIIFNMLLRFRMPADHRIRILLFRPWAAPGSVIYAIFIAGAITLVVQAVVSLVVAPLIRAWHQPRTNGTAGLFRLKAGEHVLASISGRMRQDGSWIPGTMLRSNRAIWFIPEGWESEPWTLPLMTIREISLEPNASRVWGFLTGLPERVRIVDPQSQAYWFAVNDPDRVLAWFDAGITA